MREGASPGSHSRGSSGFCIGTPVLYPFVNDHIPTPPPLPRCGRLRFSWYDGCWVLSEGEVTCKSVHVVFSRPQVGCPWKWSGVKVAHPCPTLCDRMDYTAPGVLQARTLACVALPFCRVLPNMGLSQPFCLTAWGEAQGSALSSSARWPSTRLPKQTLPCSPLALMGPSEWASAPRAAPLPLSPTGRCGAPSSWTGRPCRLPTPAGASRWFCQVRRRSPAQLAPLRTLLLEPRVAGSSPRFNHSLSTLNEIGFSGCHFTLHLAAVWSLAGVSVSPWTAACQAPLSWRALHLCPSSRIHGLFVYKLGQVGVRCLDSFIK